MTMEPTCQVSFDGDRGRCTRSLTRLSRVTKKKTLLPNAIPSLFSNIILYIFFGKNIILYINRFFLVKKNILYFPRVSVLLILSRAISLTCAYLICFQKNVRRKLRFHVHVRVVFKKVDRSLWEIETSRLTKSRSLYGS